MNEVEKQINQFIASNRVVVEQAISDTKRYFVLKNRFRTLDLQDISETIEICAALSNFKHKTSLTSSQNTCINRIL